MKYAAEYEKVGIPVFKPYGTGKFRPVQCCGSFKILHFDLVHDVPCFGFLVIHPDMGRFLYASDTEYIRYRFKHLHHILVEANYSADLIEQEAVNRTHILTGHMELQTTLDFIHVNNNPELRNVILCHLSSSNADPVMFAQEAKQVVGCPVWIAKKGLTVDVSLNPF